MKTSLKCCISMVSWECAPAVSAARPKPPAIFPPLLPPYSTFFSIRPRISSALMRRTEEGEGGPQEGRPPWSGAAGPDRDRARPLLFLSPLTLADCTLLPTSTHSALLSSPLALFLCFF